MTISLLSFSEYPIFCFHAHVLLGVDMDFTPFVREQNEMMNGFENASKPTVVAIDGVCLGGGLELSMVCCSIVFLVFASHGCFMYSVCFDLSSVDFIFCFPPAFV